MRHFRYPFSSWSLADVIFVDFGNDGAGTWYIRKEDADSLPLKMVLANREGDMESASFMCRQDDKSLYGSEWTWTYEKWWSIKQLRRGDGW